MGRSRIAACVMVLAATCVVSRGSDESDGTPRIGCAQPEFDFGRKDSRENVEHTFVLRNEGRGELRITGVDATCGCTVTSVAGSRLSPGETTQVAVTFRLAGRSGHQEKAITIASNAQNRPHLQLVMRGTALSRVTMKPGSIFFGKVGAGKRVAESMEITTDDSVSFNVREVKSDSPHFSPSCEVLRAGRSFRLEVALDSSAPEGQLSGEVRVETDNAEFPTLYIPASAHVVGALLVMPKEIVLEEGAPPATKSVFVMAGQVTKFRILDVKSPLERIKPKVVPFGEDGFRILLRELTPEPGLAGACLVITTDAPEMKEIRIPFRIVPPAAPAH